MTRESNRNTGKGKLEKFVKKDPPRTAKTKDYIVGMRADEDTYERLEAVAAASRRKIAQVLALFVEDRLPEIEKELGIKPGEKSTKRTVI
jgi:hypothetical protein